MQKIISALTLLIALATPALSEQLANTSDREVQITVVPIGSKIRIILQNPIDVQNVQDGQLVQARSKEDISADGKVCIPANTLFSGNVTHVHQDENGKCFALNFNFLTLSNNHPVPIYALPMIRSGAVRINRGEWQLMVAAVNRGPDRTNERSAKWMTMLCFKTQPFTNLNVGDDMTIELDEDIRCR